MDFAELNYDLSEDDKALKKAAHKFAEEVIRPIAKEMDTMTAEQAISDDSPVWKFLRKGYELGYHKTGIPKQFGGLELNNLQQWIVGEELIWGSAGLAVLISVAPMPFAPICAIGGETLVEAFVKPFVECNDGSIRGCWAITEPDHGSDTLIPGYPSFRDPKVTAQCLAHLDGDELVINGQKSAWISGAPTATHTILMCQTDTSMGHAGGVIAVVPLDLPGVSKGKPIEKLGQRDLCQGQIFFDNVRIPKSYVLIDKELYEAALDGWLSGTTAGMCCLGTGIARAAFEETLTYAKERVQGGKRLIEYPNIKMKLFDMFTKIEAARQLGRAAYIRNSGSEQPMLEYSLAAKNFGTQTAFEVTHEAIQVFGGNGLTKEYLIEKLFRDARATLIEDGSNETLAIAGGHRIIETYPRA
ncbi:MAG: acyl-CoA/acyl-ACP dehydrogenase [Desulfobacteraceae bacterium]|nr:MAG: acyl-CoA/acyl-ACP dehydrogenase [Desulfobacteraceae bacterium]